MLDILRRRRMWRRRPELKDSYDVVIVGGGSHGLATAYYLQKEHGIKDIAVLEKSYIGSVTQACRMCVVIGIGTPAMSLISVLQPAVQLSTCPARIVPRFVRTALTRPFTRSRPAPTTCGRSSPRRPTARRSSSARPPGSTTPGGAR